MKLGDAMTANELGTKVLLDPSVPMDELLGSVTTYNNVEGSEMKSQLRTSARVFKKMKLDSAMAALSATEKKEIDKVEKSEKKDETKTDGRSETRKPPIPRPLWNPEDKNLFFEALNEYGKDFDAIHQYISNKLKRKGVPDNQIKTKEQVRHLYYRTWHKISKYLRFSDDVKKVAQELYCLINYGELRKKLTKISEKTCMKLNELIYTGFLTVRVKGKPIRIRTPMCKALRRLNQLDETNDDIKLPSRITLELKPKDMETWMRVQEVFQNPRVKTALPLQKRISSLLTHLTERWKSQEVLEHEKLLASADFAAAVDDDKVLENVKPRTDPPLRILPPPDAVITLPTINIGEFFTMQSVCMNSYEERIGVKTPGEQLWMQAYPSLRHIHRGASRKSSFKRSRAESTSEKSAKRPCLAETTTDSNENCVVPEISLNKDIIDEAVETILALQNQESDEIGEQQQQQQDREKEETLKLEEEALLLVKREHDISRIRLGWTLNDCATLTIGDLYLMFGADSKISLEYAWDKPPTPSSVKHEDEVEKSDAVELDNDESNADDGGGSAAADDLSGTLKKLLSVAKLHYRKNIVRCPCGHVCGVPAKPTTSRAKTTGKSVKNLTAGDSKVPEQQSSHQTVQSSQATNTASVVPIILQPPLQKFPSLFRRPISPNGVLRAQLDSLQRLKPRYCNRKGRRPRSKQIIVERKLSILANKDDNDRQIVSMNIIAQDVPSLPRQIAPKLLPATNGSPNGGGATYVDSTLTSGEEFKIISLEEDKIGPAVAPDILDNATTPSRVGSPTSISNLLDMAFKDGEQAKRDGGGITSFEGLLSNNTCSTESATSPTQLLKDNDNQWLNSEVGDFSFSSFLGHLESPNKNPAVGSTIVPPDDSRMCLSQDVDAHLQSLLTESSMDLTAKFADLAAQVVDSSKK